MIGAMAPLRSRLGVCAAALFFAACNLWTGADNLGIGHNDNNRNDTIDGADDQQTSGSSGDPTGSTGSGDPSGTTTTTGPGGGADLAPADGVVITGVEVYQGVRRPLMENGAPASSSVPLVSGRDAVFRIYYQVEANFSGAPVIARVMVGESVVELEANLAGASSISDVNSTVNVWVPGDQFVSDSYSVSLLHPQDATSGENTAAYYQEALPMQSTGNALELVLVPVQYGGDGSNRLPDTSDAQLENYRRIFYKLYPVQAVNITVHAPVQWNSTISAFGQGWSGLLDALVGYRQQQGAASNDHYYGIFAPSSSINQFCSQGCVLGLSLLAQSPGDALARTGIGLGFTGVASIETAAHEVGHQHGRGHAPCGANQGLDGAFPNNTGTIADYGIDLLNGALISPNTPDFMSYCDPVHVGPYNYTNLFNRLRQVNSAQSVVATAPTTYDRVRIDHDGSLHWSDPLTLTTAPGGEQTELEVSTQTGTERVTGHFYRYDHLDGGMLLIPQRTQLTQVSIPHTLFSHAPAIDRILER